jgi:hypothetical protein
MNQKGSKRSNNYCVYVDELISTGSKTDYPLTQPAYQPGSLSEAHRVAVFWSWLHP